jgi:hypothetical protein
VRWWKKAADQGDANAQTFLGLSYQFGRGVRRDKAKAYFWLNLATTRNTDEKEDASAKLRDDAAAGLSPAELSATQKRCREWMDAFEKRKGQER